MIVASAGHIDHGKTLLVKRLTGVDTDRLPEERARGISIDLGFAYLPFADGRLIGFVDVPGHERFIRNMLAGVSGIDFAMLVVAADDGVMPQTLEHLQILDLLQVKRGAVVITKCDRVDAARVQEVRDSVARLLGTTSLAGAPFLPVSALTGEGIERLRAVLVEEAAKPSSRRAEGQHFRYAVDRAFSVAGSGTIVTGTVFNGSLSVGDTVVVSPKGEEARVRGIQVHGKPVGKVHAGERCALNLARLKLESVQRGDWVLAPELHKPTSRIDVRLKVLESESQALRHWAPVHLHLGTSDVTARVSIRRGGAIEPGRDACVRLVLDKPVTALRGDRIILRDQASSHTIGGGIVLDPFGPATRRASESRRRELAAFEYDAPEEALAALAAAALSVDLARFAASFNLTRDRLAQLANGAGLVRLGGDSSIAVLKVRYETLRGQVLDRLADFHRREPQATGMEIDLLRRVLAPELTSEAFSSLVAALAEQRLVEANGSKASLSGHVATANDADALLWQRLVPAMEAGGLIAPPIHELSVLLKLKDHVLKDFLSRKARTGEVMKVTPDRYCLRAHLADLAATLDVVAKTQAGGKFTAAHYRDATGVGRNHVIELLEFFDARGITRRLGNVRIVCKDYVPVFGVGTPPPRPEPKPAASQVHVVRPQPQRRR